MAILLRRVAGVALLGTSLDAAWVRLSASSGSMLPTEPVFCPSSAEGLGRLFAPGSFVSGLAKAEFWKRRLEEFESRNSLGVSCHVNPAIYELVTPQEFEELQRGVFYQSLQLVISGCERLLDRRVALDWGESLKMRIPTQLLRPSAGGDFPKFRLALELLRALDRHRCWALYVLRREITRIPVEAHKKLGADVANLVVSFVPPRESDSPGALLLSRQRERWQHRGCNRDSQFTKLLVSTILDRTEGSLRAIERAMTEIESGVVADDFARFFKRSRKAVDEGLEEARAGLGEVLETLDKHSVGRRLLRSALLKRVRHWSPVGTRFDPAGVNARPYRGPMSDVSLTSSASQLDNFGMDPWECVMCRDCRDLRMTMALFDAGRVVAAVANEDQRTPLETQPLASGPPEIATQTRLLLCRATASLASCEFRQNDQRYASRRMIVVDLNSSPSEGFFFFPFLANIVARCFCFYFRA